MTTAAITPMFRSAQCGEDRADRVSDSVADDFHAVVPDRSILVVSPNPELCRLVEAAFQGDSATTVRLRHSTMASLAEDGGHSVWGHDVVMYEAHPTDIAETEALRVLTAVSPSTLRFVPLDEKMLSAASTGRTADAPPAPPRERANPEPVAETQPRPSPAEMPQEQRQAPSRNGRVIAVARARGGIGATTVAVNLAAMLAATKGNGGKVILLDLDFQQGNAGFYLDVEDQGAFMDLVRNGTVPDSTFLRTAVTEHASGLHILPAPSEFAPLQALNPAIIASLLDALQADYDHVIVDLPQAVVDWVEPVLTRAAQVLLVTDTSVPAIRQAGRLIGVFTEDNPTLPLDIVVNREKRPLVLSASQKEAARVLDRPLSHWIPRDEAAARRAVDRGIALAEIAPRSAMTKALRLLAAGLVSDSTAKRQSS